MKTLLFTLEYPPMIGGVANYYENLVKNYSDGMVVLDNSDNKLVNSQSRFIKWWPAIKELKKAIKINKTNLVIVGQILPLGIVTWLLSFIIDFKYVVVLHGMDLSLAISSKKKLWITTKILDKAKAVICANSYTGEQVKLYLRPSQIGKVKIINPGITDNFPELKISKIVELKKRYNLENKIILLSVGRLVKRKGYDVTLQALAEALKQEVNLMYVIIGNGPELESINGLVARYELQDNVLLLTDIGHDDKMLWYQTCDIFSMISRNIDGDYEGFGIVYLEANLVNKPVIAGIAGGVGDAVEHEINGLLVDPENISEISRAIVKLAQFKGLRDRLGKQGRERALIKFNWIKQVGKLEDIVNKP